MSGLFSYLHKCILITQDLSNVAHTRIVNSDTAINVKIEDKAKKIHFDQVYYWTVKISIKNSKTNSN